MPEDRQKNKHIKCHFFSPKERKLYINQTLTLQENHERKGKYSLVCPPHALHLALMLWPLELCVIIGTRKYFHAASREVTDLYREVTVNSSQRIHDPKKITTFGQSHLDVRPSRRSNQINIGKENNTTAFFLPNLATHETVDNRGNKDYDEMAAHPSPLISTQERKICPPDLNARSETPSICT